MDAGADDMLVSRIMAASFRLENRGLRRLALLDTEIYIRWRWRETVCGSDCWTYHGQLPEAFRVHLYWHPARYDACKSDDTRSTFTNDVDSLFHNMRRQERHMELRLLTPKKKPIEPHWLICKVAWLNERGSETVFKL